MSLHPKIIDLTLDRVLRLLAALDHPERRLPPVIHLAGTNGKGSTLAMIRAGLEGAGKSAHAYTSPHLVRFHERIRVAGKLIEEPVLSALLLECETVNQAIPITYFEITTCAAFLAFARTAADFTLLEVGLGGRLDATNVIDKPRLSIITPVSFDHPQYLGNTVAEIAFEKAGILKRGVTCIVGPQPDDALDVIEKQAQRVGAPLLVHGQHWHVGTEHGRLVFQDETGLLDLPLPNLIGAHQVQNAGAAIAALRFLGFGEDACRAAVTRAEWPARMQRLRSGPLVAAAPDAEIWLDGGHNAACGQALAESLLDLPKRPLHMICGMLNTKDIGGYLAPLAPLVKSFYGVGIPNEINTLPAEKTVFEAVRAGMQQAEVADSVLAATSAIAAIEPKARIMICGSLYLAGQVLRDNG
ncbi:MAG: bifunctional folylpolyglutamate synthase/dihydrofolate synthase [Rhodobacteraceae bacterium]|nr:bifunctional folylpolyglutamate synthase/dihydrofolate synthase [Paracoccaceae bacterium]